MNLDDRDFERYKAWYDLISSTAGKFGALYQMDGKTHFSGLGSGTTVGCTACDSMVMIGDSCYNCNEYDEVEFYTSRHYELKKQLPEKKAVVVKKIETGPMESRDELLSRYPSFRNLQSVED